MATGEGKAINPSDTSELTLYQIEDVMLADYRLEDRDSVRWLRAELKDTPNWFKFDVNILNIHDCRLNADFALWIIQCHCSVILWRQM